jgi:organic hydroperoxide reductase OsmC/OhrA
MSSTHKYNLTVKWTGNTGSGTSNARIYSRDHTIFIDNKTEILASSDPMYRGDKSRHNPEELLLAALSSCHMLSYLFVCATNGVVVIEYADHATGIMSETAVGGGHFTEVTLSPDVTVSETSMIEKANALHKEASALCIIASSVNFPVHHNASAHI